MPVWFSDAEHAVIEAACERLIPAVEGVGPGARRAGVADYIDRTLGAFTFDPPRIWAGGPFSGRHGGTAGRVAQLSVAPEIPHQNDLVHTTHGSTLSFLTSNFSIRIW